LHDDDPSEGPDRPEQDPLAALIQPPERGLSGDPATEALHQRAKLAEDRLAEVLTAYRQVKTESEGFKDRISRNLERRFDQRRERLLLKFIEILDNLDRALEATEQTYTGTPMIEGIILVRTQLLSVLQEEGLERIPVLGLAYDPAVAEAVETRAVPEAEHHHVVVKELLRGYRLNGRVARAARVAIGEYQGEEAAAGTEAADGLVGADEVEEQRLPAAPAPSAEAGLDAALDELLSADTDMPLDPEPMEPAPPPRHPAPKAAPAPTRTPPATPDGEIDLLKEVLDDENG
jgi:molecular chaperone GrpE